MAKTINLGQIVEAVKALDPARINPHDCALTLSNAWMLASLSCTDSSEIASTQNAILKTTAVCYDGYVAISGGPIGNACLFLRSVKMMDSEFVARVYGTLHVNGQI